MTEDQMRKRIAEKVICYKWKFTPLIHATQKDADEAMEIASDIIELVRDNASAFEDPKGCVI